MNHLQWVEHMKGQFKKFYTFDHIAYVYGSKQFANEVQSILSKPDTEATEKELKILMKVELSLC
jgi:hypothetical protein